MEISYKKLFVMIVEKDMTNADVRKAAKLSTSTFDKLKKNKLVALDVLIRICAVLQCQVGELMEIIKYPELNES
ncbi:helix-turn-helix domain-containing protein [Anaerosporobacter sp.]|uniref:helix-turn-helix domain-containing protein n=1 Tax=Anaerosporobacter sp. TaxID=1872529 RepID=UPI00286F9679|nr:helix-turn-helix transcriptional regulator [Anaerosporobacter sp.]